MVARLGGGGHRTDTSWILVSSLNCDLGQVTELLSFSFIKWSPSISPSDFNQGSTWHTLSRVLPKASVQWTLVPPLVNIYWDVFSVKEPGETKMSRTGFIGDSLLRYFSSLTFYDLIKTEIKAKRSWGPQSHYHFPFSNFFLNVLAVLLNEFYSTFSSLFSFLVSSSSWDINHLI